MDNSTYGLILDSIADAVKAGKQDVALGAIESLRGFLFSIGKPEVSPVKARKTVRVFDIYRCVSNDETRQFMTGVYHDKEAELAVATNGRLVIQIRSAYSPEHAGEIILQDGRKLSGQFPAWRRVTPEKKDMGEKVIDWADVRSKLDAARPYIRAMKRCKIEKEKREPTILLAGVRIAYEYAEMACDFMDVYKDAKFFIHNGEDRYGTPATGRSVVLLSGSWKKPDAMFIIMPMAPLDADEKGNYKEMGGLTWMNVKIDASALVHLHHKDWYERKKQNVPSEQDKKDEDTIKMMADFLNIKIEEE